MMEEESVLDVCALADMVFTCILELNVFALAATVSLCRTNEERVFS